MMDDCLDIPQTTPPLRQLQGRGALQNPTGRFESIELIYDPAELPPEDSDGQFIEGSWPDPNRLPTQFFKDHTQSIISTNDSPDISFDASMNIYRGCEHGCIYCYARPTHEYLGLSAGLDFESKIFVKTEAPQLLRKALAAKSWRPQVVVLSGVTDCYQPAERHFKLTRECLKVFLEFRNPVSIITKNHLVTRDIDVLGELAKFNCARVMVSLTTLDAELARVMEPRTAQPAMRLKAIEELASAGIPVGVMMAPIIPGLTDHEIDKLLKAAADAGAQSAGYTIVRLPYGVKELFPTWLETHYPNRKNKVLNLLRGMRNGELNDNRFGKRMGGVGAYADNIDQLFELARKRHGFKGFSRLSVEHFQAAAGKQLRLF